MQKMRFIFSFVLFALSCSLWAQPRTMSLHDCLAYARRHAFANRSGHLAVELARTDKRIQASAMLPTLGFSAGGDLNFGRGVDPETNTYDTKHTFHNGYSLTMQLPLFDGMVSLNTYRAARMSELMQRKAAENEADRISLAVIRAYYNILYHSALAGQMESLLASDRRHLEATERRAVLGSKSEADVNEMKALVAGDEYELLNQQNLRHKAILELKAQMGMPLDEDFLVDDTIRMKARPCNADVPAQLHPRIMQAEYNLRRSRYLLRAAYGNFMPKLSLNGGLSTSYFKVLGKENKAPDFASQWRLNMGQYVGLSLSVPLFDSGANILRLKRAKSAFRQQQVELEKTRYEIEREQNEAWLDMNAAESEWRAAKARVEAEEVANRAIRRKYELGGASVLDLYTGNSKLATARAALVGKQIQTIINRIVYEYYQGVPLFGE